MFPLFLAPSAGRLSLSTTQHSTDERKVKFSGADCFEEDKIWMSLIPRKRLKKVSEAD